MAPDNALRHQDVGIHQARSGFISLANQLRLAFKVAGAAVKHRTSIGAPAANSRSITTSWETCGVSHYLTRTTQPIWGDIFFYCLRSNPLQPSLVSKSPDRAVTAFAASVTADLAQPSGLVVHSHTLHDGSVGPLTEGGLLPSSVGRPAFKRTYPSAELYRQRGLRLPKAKASPLRANEATKVLLYSLKEHDFSPGA